MFGGLKNGIKELFEHKHHEDTSLLSVQNSVDLDNRMREFMNLPEPREYPNEPQQPYAVSDMMCFDAIHSAINGYIDD